MTAREMVAALEGEASHFGARLAISTAVRLREPDSLAVARAALIAALERGERAEAETARLRAILAEDHGPNCGCVRGHPEECSWPVEPEIARLREELAALRQRIADAPTAWLIVRSWMDGDVSPFRVAEQRIYPSRELAQRALPDGEPRRVRLVPDPEEVSDSSP